jgi:hypothetical protein
VRPTNVLVFHRSEILPAYIPAILGWRYPSIGNSVYVSPQDGEARARQGFNRGETMCLRQRNFVDAYRLQRMTVAVEDLPESVGYGHESDPQQGANIRWLIIPLASFMNSKVRPFPCSYWESTREKHGAVEQPGKMCFMQVFVSQ